MPVRDGWRRRYGGRFWREERLQLGGPGVRPDERSDEVADVVRLEFLARKGLGGFVTRRGFCVQRAAAALASAASSFSLCRRA